VRHRQRRTGVSKKGRNVTCLGKAINGTGGS